MSTPQPRACIAVFGLALALCCRPAYALDLAAADAALEAWRLGEVQQLLATTNADSSDARYIAARLALASYQHTLATKLARECDRLARDNPQRSRCAEVEGEALGLQVALSGDDLATLGLAGRLQSTLTRATRLNANNLRAQLLLARFRRVAPWLLGGSAGQADAGIARAIRLAPAFADEFRGVDAYDAKDYPRATTHLRRAARALPNRAAAPYYLALAVEQQGDVDAARIQLRDVVARFPEFHEASFRLAVLEVEAQPARAAQLLRRYIPVAIDAGNKRLAKCWRHLGRAEELLGHRDAAADAYRRALRLKPGDNVASKALQRVTQGA